MFAITIIIISTWCGLTAYISAVLFHNKKIVQVVHLRSQAPVGFTVSVCVE